MINTIFFDIGGVLINIHPEKCLEYWANCTDIPLQVIKKVFPEKAHTLYETGQLSEHAFFLAFQNALPQPYYLTESDFWYGWQQLLGKETPVVQGLKHLSGQYNIWLLSNTNPQHIRTERKRQVSFLDFVDGKIYSFDAGARKPNFSIFEFALEYSGARASESVFIDDLIENVKAARILGFNAIHYENVNQLIKELNKKSIAVSEMEVSV